MLINVSVSHNMTYFAPMQIEYADMPQLLGSKIEWSAGQFRDQYRDSNHWIPNQNILVFDFDVFTADFFKFFEQFYCLVGTTKSHNKEKSGVICPRYRMVCPVETLNISKDHYSDIYFYIANRLGADLACKDVARKWTGNSSPDFEYWFFNGERIDWQTIKIEKKPREVINHPENKSDFMRISSWDRMFKPELIESGNRHTSFVKYSYWARDNGCSVYDCQIILDWINDKISNPLKEKELHSILRGVYKRL